MTRWIACLIVVFACGKREPARRPGEELVSELASIKAEMCACPDDACARKVKTKHDALEQTGAQRYGEPDKLPADVHGQLEKLDGEMRECMNKLAPPAAE